MLRIVPTKLRRLFPPDDPIARAIAALCILREDLLLELFGVIEERLGKLDENDRGHRRTYFWRNTLRTLEEIRDLLNAVNSNAAFRETFATLSPEAHEKFELIKKELNKASQAFLAVFRNQIGGHLDTDFIQKGLEALDPGDESLMQLGDILGKTRFRFTSDLVWTAILGMHPDRKDAAGKLDDILGASARLTPVVSAIDDVFGWYVRTRRRL